MATDDTRRLDAEVAEKVMGWERWTCSDYGYREADLFKDATHLTTWRKVGPEIPLGEHAEAMVPRYSTDIAADYEVLKHVRETWEPTAFAAFMAALRHIHHDRIAAFTRARKWNAYRDGNRSEVMYEPGDYSRAALAALATLAPAKEEA